MSRKLAIRFMLSLLLLLSQQMVVSHAMSHWAGAAHVQQAGEEDSRLSAAVAQDQSCDQCLALAQLAGAVGSEPFRFVPAAGDNIGILAPLHGGPFLAVHPYFRSRAPPALS